MFSKIREFVKLVGLSRKTQFFTFPGKKKSLEIDSSYGQGSFVPETFKVGCFFFAYNVFSYSSIKSDNSVERNL